MAYTETDVFNVAVSAGTGTNTAISDVNAQGRAAELCRLHYPKVRDKVLAAAPWYCAKGLKLLELVAQADSGPWAPGMPEPNWNFTYKLPNDFIHPRYTSTFARFELGNDGAQNVMYSNEEGAVLVYTFRQMNVAQWPQYLFDAVAYGLGAAICWALTGKADRMQLAIQTANQQIMVARELAANESNVQYESLPPWLAARGVSGPMYPDRYIYPVGPLLAWPNVR